MLDTLFTIISCASVSGMAYTCYQYGPILQQKINDSSLKKYKDMIYDNKSNKIFNERMICNISCSLTGMLIGRYLWPVCIPFVLYDIEKRHGSIIRKLIKKT
jgi:hypothetical protein